jgi:hypothetical protein
LLLLLLLLLLLVNTLYSPSCGTGGGFCLLGGIGGIGGGCTLAGFRLLGRGGGSLLLFELLFTILATTGCCSRRIPCWGF